MAKEPNGAGGKKKSFTEQFCIHIANESGWIFLARLLVQTHNCIYYAECKIFGTKSFLLFASKREIISKPNDHIIFAHRKGWLASSRYQIETSEILNYWPLSPETGTIAIDSQIGLINKLGTRIVFKLLQDKI